MEPQEIAQEILALIPNYRRWLKGDYDAFHGTRLCVRGAMQCIFAVTGAEQRAFADRFCDAAREAYPERFGYLPEHGVSELGRICTINDDEDMTYEGIRQLLEKIAAG
jgi:hypothetical protein